MRQIFVFGSNETGRHGKGAAKEACKYHGAEYGVGEGLTGESYAIPTKDKNLKPLSLDRIHGAICSFLRFAASNPDMSFYFTPVGTGLTGYSVKDILSGIDINEVPSNVLFTASWFKEV